MRWVWAAVGMMIAALLPTAAHGQASIVAVRRIVNYPTSPAASPYIAAGQDDPGYQAWYLADPAHAAAVRGFHEYLRSWGVGDIVPTWQLLRTATMWRECGAPPFEVPPADGWPNIVETLRYVGAVVKPAIGAVEPVSVYRNDRLNACAGGAGQSTHRTVGAIDMVPVAPISREALMLALCRLHLAVESGPTIGLGFYKGLRFHIDAKKYREWGPRGARGTWGCAGVVAEGAMPFGGTVVAESVPTPAPTPVFPPAEVAAPVPPAPRPVGAVTGTGGRSGEDPLAPPTTGDPLSPPG